MTPDLDAALCRAIAGYALETEGRPKSYAAWKHVPPVEVPVAMMTASSWDEARAGFLADCRAMGMSTQGISVEPL